MITQYTYYRGILRCQFRTSGNNELGKEHRSIFSHLELEPKFEFFEAEEVDEATYTAWITKYQKGPHLRESKQVNVDYYNSSDAHDGKRMMADGILLGVDTDPTLVDQQFLNWKDIQNAHAPEKYLHSCFIAYTPQSNHGRISGPAMLRRIKHVDPNGKELIGSPKKLLDSQSILEKQGCFHQSRGCVHRVYGFNLALKNWINSQFGGIFGANLIGREPNGCIPSLLPSGCSGAGCQRFGCGILSLLVALAFLWWLLKSIFFGDADLHEHQKERIVERIVHDTIYIQKDSRVDTVTYVDETTNTTVKMLSLPNVQFEKGKAKLLRSSIPQLNELAAYLQENKEVQAEIIGHTDSDGDAEQNRILSQARAEALRAYLIQNGIDGRRVKATGKGESEPVTENETAEGRAMNRRVEVKLSHYNTTKTVRKEQKKKE